MDESHYLKQARQLLKSVQGKPVTVEERRELSLELAGCMIQEARRCQTSQEHHQQTQLAEMLSDPKGRIFTMRMADQCFRSKNGSRVVDQMNFLLKKFGVPKFLGWFKQLQMVAFKMGGGLIPSVSAKMAKLMLRKETETVIIPGEWSKLKKHMKHRYKDGVRLNLNHLGEAILGEEEANKRLETYIEDLKKPEIEYVSIKISTIFSQINLLAWDDTIEVLAERLRTLYRVAAENEYVRKDGKRVPKFVNLDMEEYRDLHLTVQLFRKVLDEPEFFHFTAGIVLQSYLPDSYLLQQELTVWAMQRVASGGAPIKIRLVKGANLAMEQVESALRGWPQAPYTHKTEVDANFKRMMLYAFEKEHAKAVRVGIGSHNLFDVAFAMLLREENGVQEFTSFEMLEGMADHMRRVVQYLSGDMLLYCPVAKEHEFQNAVAYLVRRLDENTAPENFLRHAFDMIPGTINWQQQASLFSFACHQVQNLNYQQRRTQNRLVPITLQKEETPFVNEPDTDWSLQNNRRWARHLAEVWKDKAIEEVPLVVAGKEQLKESKNVKKDPSYPDKDLYSYSLADENDLEKALVCAEKAAVSFAKTTPEERSALLKKVAHELRVKRGDLIGAMMKDTAKIISEADPEVSEAVDFVEYYRRSQEEVFSLNDTEVTPRGVTVIAPPWNFPCAIACGGVAAALATGNSVILKPAPESVYVAFELAKVFWEAGVSKEVLQFLPCDDKTIASELVKDKRVASVVLTGATSTARHLLSLRPDMHLMAETGGKNAMIVTALADRDLAVHTIVHSAFFHAGQKCSACSLAILEEEVYNDESFRRQLVDATKSLKVGLPWDLSTQVNPLIRAPGEDLKWALTTLDEGEEWLVEPKQDKDNPHLFSPGIKLGVKPFSRSHTTEFFGPVLSLIKAKDLNEAIEFANATPYGLTSGLQTLDEREKLEWEQKIEAGNCYINRTTTGAIVQRQPFGGCKASNFGRGAKAGGPNFLTQLVTVKQKSLPREQGLIKPELEAFSNEVEKMLSGDELDLWGAACGSYSFFFNHRFKISEDVQRLLGEDNIFEYRPQKVTLLRLQKEDKLIDLLLSVAAAIVTKAPLQISSDLQTKKSFEGPFEKAFPSWIKWVVEDQETYLFRIKSEKIKRLRFLSYADSLFEMLSQEGVDLLKEPVVANGRFELLNYLREVSLCHDYHRYGNLGSRETEDRAPLPASTIDLASS